MISAHILREISVWKPDDFSIDSAEQTITIYKHPFDPELFALGPVIDGSVDCFLENLSHISQKQNVTRNIPKRLKYVL